MGMLWKFLEERVDIIYDNETSELMIYLNNIIDGQ